MLCSAAAQQAQQLQAACRAELLDMLCGKVEVVAPEALTINKFLGSGGFGEVRAGVRGWVVASGRLREGCAI